MNRNIQVSTSKQPEQGEGDQLCDGIFGINKFMIQHESLSKKLLSQRLMFLSQLKKIPEPSKKDKMWRKSKIDQFTPEKFKLLPDEQFPKNELIEDEISTIGQDDFAGSIQITPENISAKLDEKLVKLGVILTDLRTAETKYSQILEKIMGKIVTSRDNKFSTLTLAKPQFGTILYLPKGIKIEKPIQARFIWRGSGFLHTYYSLILLEDNSFVTVIQEFDGKGLNRSENAFSRVMEIQIGRKATLNYTEVNTFDKLWWNLADEYSKVLQGGKINWAVFSDGSYYSKTFLGVNLAGKESKAKITGVLIPSGETQIDFDTFQKHSVPHTTSDLLFRNAMADQARSNWSGMIKVEGDSVKADGYQSHQSLLLCGQPHVESNPGLEILTDDVKCSHDVTVGDIDEDQIFYLKTRGIPESQARQFIAEGFLESSLVRIEDKMSKDLIRERIQHDLSRLHCQ